MKNWIKSLDRRLLLVGLIGVFIGISGFAATSQTLKATDSPEFCSSCHVMDTAYETFMDSSHATLSCNDCHAPNDNVVSKLTFKAKAGLSHMYMNTIGSDDIPDVIQANEASQEVIESNCIRCHEPSLENVVYHDVKEGGCISCHGDIPHGSEMYKPDDWYEPMDVDVRK
ncbi:cytochrome c3 family protein [Texcoconibacillus texcoconensis]|uniref:Cytochrome c nitrite reductase small subunit n=1 Tax=Texcoconibacillus texcoconensis TaxID=1095777 RepID=A0A840QTU1_9BACI|nr:NapC/NirT family cytochrome c [Texcoconibacillus texcoconensis]MBB5174795.1 cytochrome c nitrite reductase small subunit [Texcoconibacillus texcoconensis]